MIRFKRKVLGIKSEGTYGTDAVPTAAANAILTRNVQLQFLELDYEKRNIDTGYSGHQGEVIVGQRFEMRFEVEIAGSSALGVAPGFSPILKAAACSETLNGGVSVVYAPAHPAAAVSASVYFWLDGVLYKGVGCWADVGLRFPRGRVPFFAVRLVGLHVAPVDQAVPTPTLTGFKKPVAVNLANTSVMTLHTFAGKFSDLSIDFGNQIRYRNLPNSEAVRLIDRETVGQAVLEDELIGTKDWPSIIKAETLGALAVTHGPAANRVTIAAANVQITRPRKQVSDDLVDNAFGLNFVPSSAGNDEWSITLL
jgi:hypothetical protein